MSVVPRSGALAQTRLPSKFDQRLARILDHATKIFCEKGYERASMRDLSRACGMSLAGLYYYFDSKERMLYLIEKELFGQVTELLDQKLNGTADPEERVRLFIENHIMFFLSRQNAMKVLAHEDDALSGEMRAEIQAIKREYYHGCLTLLEQLKLRKKLQFQSRIAAMSLFGMMNWLHTWYNPSVDGTPALLAKEVTEIFLRGVYRNNGQRLH
jgi:AcrR family transcriptional regulator